jgi:cytochrome c
MSSWVERLRHPRGTADQEQRRHPRESGDPGCGAKRRRAGWSAGLDSRFRGNDGILRAARVVGLAIGVALTAAHAQAQSKFPGIGRAATPAEVKAWDIDVRPDFQGLPPGSGSVARGQQVWEDKCASCHGVFGESNSVFNPLVGGTTKADVERGRVASLARPDYPARTTLMKVATVSTLWDYINRAMPWNSPKSLTVEEVYATTAYLLHLGEIVPVDFTLSDRNIAEVQKRLPNRDGMTTAHALWPGTELGGTRKPDVAGTRCMRDCAVEPKVASLLPPHARNAHGNLAEQNRIVGPQRGIDTAGKAAAVSAPAAKPAAAAGGAVQSLLQKNNCTACHAAGQRVVGPSWAEVAQRHAGKADYLAGKIREGGSGVWGSIPMPPQALDDAAARQIADWLAAGAKP